MAEPGSTGKAGACSQYKAVSHQRETMFTRYSPISCNMFLYPQICQLNKNYKMYILYVHILRVHVYLLSHVKFYHLEKSEKFSSWNLRVQYVFYKSIPPPKNKKKTNKTHIICCISDRYQFLGVLPGC